jgi:hypothetical protein
MDNNQNKIPLCPPLKKGDEKIRTRIFWEIDVPGWAMDHLAGHIMEKLPEFEHEIRAGINPAPTGGEIRVLMYVGQFKKFDGDKQTIMHLDGNRWYENYDIKFDI